MKTTYRQPIYLTSQGVELEAKQKKFRMKVLSNLAKNIATSYPGWLQVRVWVAENLTNYARLYVGGNGGYLVITPRGISEFDMQKVRGKSTEVQTINILPWQRKEYIAYRNQLFGETKEFLDDVMSAEHDAWDALAKKLGYSQSASTSMNVLDASSVFDIDPVQDVPISSNQAVLDAAKRGDVVNIGKSKWVVFAAASVSGGMLSLFKFGSKATKMYRAYIDGDSVSVRQIDGMADFVGPVLATGPLEITNEAAKLT
jgi:hypothetical protein